MKAFFRIMFLASIPIAVGACTQTTAESPGTTTTALSTPAAQSTTAASLPNGTLQASSLGETVTLVVQQGQPVAYRSPSFSTADVRRLPNGDIQIGGSGGATIRDVRVEGRQVSGNWQFRGPSRQIVFR